MLTGSHALGVLLDGWSAAGRPTILQAAADGRWEAARSIDLPTTPERGRALVRDAGPAEADVAVELEWLGRPLVFVGARRGPDDVAAFEDAIAGLAGEAPAGVAEALAAVAGGTPVEIDHVELGAANAWQSVGPLRVWSRDAGHADGSLADRLHDHPALARCPAPVALEVAFRRPRACWLGVEVSTPSDGAHVVAAAAVEALLTRLLPAGA